MISQESWESQNHQMNSIVWGFRKRGKTELKIVLVRMSSDDYSTFEFRHHQILAEDTIQEFLLIKQEVIGIL